MPFADAKYPHDMRLIRAAPDLLEAIDQVTAALETCMVHHGQQWSDCDRYWRQHYIDRARKAQGLAEGHDPWPFGMEPETLPQPD